MKRFNLLILGVVVALSAQATHIVGGEFEMLYKGVNPITGDHLYTISLILYFDQNSKNVKTAKDKDVIIRIFRKRDNAVIDSYLKLDSLPSTAVEYYQPECSNGLAMRTRRMYYTYQVDNQQALYALNPSKYNDPQGYYLAWERCCRNYNITNVYSDDPDVGGIYAGQTFYLEFPPLVKDGNPFINSSPALFPPLSDYACPGSLYYVDFAGEDADGDSLAYSLITPLNTKSNDALPPPDNDGVSYPRAGPYPEVIWRSPFSLNNITGGNPDLKISADGLLTVVPQFQGLFVFSVKCEEYRDKIKIGEVRRDFQLLVLAECQTDQNPVIEAKPKNSGSFVANHLTVSFDDTVPDEDRCIEIRVTDPDSGNPNHGNAEDVKIRAVPLGFRDDITAILPQISSAQLDGSGASVTFNVCFPACPYTGGPYKIGIIAMDHACPLPKLDTVVISVDMTMPPNSPAKFQEHLIDQTVLEGSTIYEHDLIGTDSDGDSLTLSLMPGDFDLPRYGFVFTDDHPVPDGTAKGKLTWNTKCDQVDFSDRTDFDLTFLLDDDDKCKINPPDTMRFKLDIDLVNVHPPVIYYGPDKEDTEIVLMTDKIFDTIDFPVWGYDPDNDNLQLNGSGLDFSMSDMGATFPGDTGMPPLESDFNWFLDCSKFDLALKNQYDFKFIVVDNHNRCNYYLADTLDVIVTVAPPDNQAPSVKINAVSEGQTLSYSMGETITLAVTGTDPDTSPTDLLTLNVAEQTGKLKGYSFTSAPAKANVSGIFSWTPACSIFENMHYDSEPYENIYKFSFAVADQRCHDIKTDTTTVNIRVRDVDQEAAKFLPPNFVSANNDGLNDFFAMVKEDPDTKELVNILPKDNCKGRFVGIHIYNRWGKEVFSSGDRNFRWYPDNLTSGVYFYSLIFSDKEYKGTVTVRL
jgi:hypothetical protein